MDKKDQGICVYDFDNSINTNNESLKSLNLKKKLIPKIPSQNNSIIKSFSINKNINRVPLFAIKSNLTNRCSPKTYDINNNYTKSEKYY
jgi:hypothetical protein